MARATCPRSSVEVGQKCSKNYKEKNKAAFFSPSENRCLSASNLKPEEREFVVDSSASMHMISKKDLSDAEMDTLTKSCSPTIVITANGEAQTHEEATVYVNELDIFLTMKVLENTPAVLSLGKLCDENGYSYEWINGQNHISFFKPVFEYNVPRRTSFRSWFQACQQVLPPVLHIVHPDTITHSKIVSSRTRLHYPSQKRWLPSDRGIRKPPRRARRGAPACSHPHG